MVVGGGREVGIAPSLRGENYRAPKYLTYSDSEPGRNSAGGMRALRRPPYVDPCARAFSAPHIDEVAQCGATKQPRWAELKATQS